MNRLVACLLAGVVIVTPFSAQAQMVATNAPSQTVAPRFEINTPSVTTIDTPSVTLITAPPIKTAPPAAPTINVAPVAAPVEAQLSGLAQAIKTALSVYYPAGGAQSEKPGEGETLYFFYSQRNFEPVWLTTMPAGQAQFTPAAKRIVSVFENSGHEGFRPTDYLTPALNIVAAGSDLAKLAEVETAFSSAALLYANHAYGGRIKPSSVSDQFDVPQRLVNKATVIAELAATTTPETVLANLDPKHPEFLALKAALATFDDANLVKPVVIPGGPSLKPGMDDPRVPLIRERLQLPAAVDGSTIYDAELVDAVMRTQESLGLDADGVAGPATIAALNGGGAITRADLIANMERWRWMPDDLGNFNVFVNIPEFRLAISRNGQETYSTRVVVGTPKNETPIFSDAIRHIVVNPYWNVPNSIAKNEIGPKLQKNPGYLDNQNMEISYKGETVSAYRINWAAVAPGSFPFSVRQLPGPTNSLGQIKFLFPNKHDVYLHDTPSKALFNRSARALSHGCVRVQNPMEFADALLVNEDTISRSSLEAMFGAKERWVNPKKTIPVHLAYFTVRPDANGTLRTFGDIYGHNHKLIEMLKL